MKEPVRPTNAEELSIRMGVQHNNHVGVTNSLARDFPHALKLFRDSAQFVRDIPTAPGAEEMESLPDRFAGLNEQYMELAQQTKQVLVKMHELARKHQQYVETARAIAKQRAARIGSSAGRSF